MSLGNVLVGTDFSDSAALAIERAAWLPIGRGSSVTVVHVVRPRWPARHSEALRKVAQDKLAATEALLVRKEQRAFNVFSVLLDGNVTDALCERARDLRAQLVVLGHGGASRNALVGSTALQVARAVGCAVLVVRRPAAGPYERPLVAVDSSSLAGEVLAFAAHMCGDIAPTLVHAYLSFGDETRRLLREAEVGDGEIEDYVRGAEREARREVERLVAVAGVRPRELVLREGDAREAIVDEARRREADLVVAGITGHSRLAHRLMGSVAEEVVRSAPCDVLLVR